MPADDRPSLPIPFEESRWLRHLYLLIGIAFLWWGLTSDAAFLPFLLAALAISVWAEAVFAAGKDR